MKPQMEIVKIQLTQMLCESPGSYDGRSLGIPKEKVEDENDIF